MTRTVTIKRHITVALLLLVTVGIIFATVWLSGHSYSKVNAVPFEQIFWLKERVEQRPISTQVLAVIIMPIVGNVLIFVPWGFLMFVTLYNLERPTVQTYVLTILLGFSFTIAIEAWQYFLPSRVADINDVIWNTVGTIAGALLGHLRRRVHFQFE